MLIVNTNYKDPLAHTKLLEAFEECFSEKETEPVFICIGSERHILDCLGPLCGTLIKASIPDLTVYGTLDSPIHARNLVRELQIIKQRHPEMIQLAVDASVGEESEIGNLQLRKGALIPGKALAKNLPAVGDFSLTGIVDKRTSKNNGTENSRGLAHVYHMARMIQSVVEEWYRIKP